MFDLTLVGGDEWIDERTNRRMNRSLSVFYKTCPPLGLLPKNLSGYVGSCRNALLNWELTAKRTKPCKALSIEYVCLLLVTDVEPQGAFLPLVHLSILISTHQVSQRPQRERSPVEHRGTLFVRPSIPLFVRLSPP